MSTAGLTRYSGEFADRGREAAFRTHLLDENLRHARLVFLLTAGLNILFIASDWRFVGTPHMWVAFPARVLVIATGVGCYLLARRASSSRALQRITAAWMALSTIGIALLVTSHTDIALFAVLLVPLVYYLASPSSYGWTVAGGAGASAAMLLAFLLPDPPPTALGLVIVVFCMNVALAMTVLRTNRLRRLEWAAGTELARSRHTLESLFNAAPVPLLITRRECGTLVRSNDAGVSFFATTHELAGKGQEGYADPSTRAHLLDQVARHGRISSFETRMRLADGNVRDVLMAASPIEVDGEACLMTGIVDITTRKALEAHLKEMATTDALTGLANRTRFFATAESEIRRAARNQRQPSLLMIDLDHFKAVNDQHGHGTGDLVLKAFADLVVGMVGEHDIAARLGGEEFAILLPEADLTAAARLGERLRGAVEAMRFDPVPSLRLTISVGAARIEHGETAPDPALSRADRALYRAKRAGRNRVSATDEQRLDGESGARHG